MNKLSTRYCRGKVQLKSLSTEPIRSQILSISILTSADYRYAQFYAYLTCASLMMTGTFVGNTSSSLDGDWCFRGQHEQFTGWRLVLSWATRAVHWMATGAFVGNTSSSLDGDWCFREQHEQFTGWRLVLSWATRAVHWMATGAFVGNTSSSLDGDWYFRGQHEQFTGWRLVLSWATRAVHWMATGKVG